MRKIFLVVLLLSLVLNLYSAEYYKSNELGQKLGNESSIGQEGYFLEVSDNTQTLYYNGIVYCTTTTIISQNNRTVSKNYSSGNVETYKYEDGLLKAYTNNDISIVYNYIGNKLSFCIVNENEIFFLRSANDGTLIAIRRNLEVDLIGESYLYQNGEFYDLVSNSLVFTGSYNTLDDGSFTFNEGEKQYHYSPSGHLLSITSDSETIEFSYVDEVVSLIKSTKSDGSYSISSYENGILVSVNEYDSSDVITISTDYSKGTIIKTLYKDGRAVADIYYKDDNVTVETIKYR